MIPCSRRVGPIEYAFTCWWRHWSVFRIPGVQEHHSVGGGSVVKVYAPELAYHSHQYWLSFLQSTGLRSNGMIRTLRPTVFAALLLLSVVDARWGDWSILGQLQHPTSSDGVQHDGLADRQSWTTKYATGQIKSPRPLIGILTQPCSLCPGRCAQQTLQLCLLRSHALVVETSWGS